MDSSDQDYTRAIDDELLHYVMMYGPREELQAYYANPFLPLIASVWVDIFTIDDVILEKLRAWSEFPKSSEKRLETWFIQHQVYFGEDLYMNDVAIAG